jgi:nicotinate phosphoribosyltransferase
VTAGEARGPEWALLTDLYELTMACGYWRLGLADREAVFVLSFRENPFDHPFSIACGLAQIVELLTDFHFSADAGEYLQSLTGADDRPLFDPRFLDYLATLRLRVDLDAVEEGTAVFPHEPLVRVRGPLLECQILESLLLNVVNFQTLVATKAQRVCRAAGRGSVIEFGLRRAQGVNGGLAASRAAYVGGCAGTSNVLAGRLYDIPVRGTHAHSWVMCFPDELTAFDAYAEVLPNNCIFLVDTYDTRRGLEHAVQVGRQLQARGHRLLGIRLDSGDLVSLSRLARQMLDDAGLTEAVVLASNDLDEYQIAALRAQGACIDVWGVGTRLATAYDQPALGGIYKLTALRSTQGNWDYKLKLSEQPAKASTPGVQRLRRYRIGDCWIGDLIYDEVIGVADQPEAVLPDGTRRQLPRTAETEDLLIPVLRAGQLVRPMPSTRAARQRAMEQSALARNALNALPAESDYPVGIEPRLHALRQHMIAALEDTKR